MLQLHFLLKNVIFFLYLHDAGQARSGIFDAFYMEGCLISSTISDQLEMKVKQMK